MFLLISKLFFTSLKLTVFVEFKNLFFISVFSLICLLFIPTVFCFIYLLSFSILLSPILISSMKRTFLLLLLWNFVFSLSVIGCWTLVYRSVFFSVLCVILFILSSSSIIVSITLETIVLFFWFKFEISESYEAFSYFKYFSFNCWSISILYISINKNTFFLINLLICFILCNDLLTILFHIFGYLFDISTASVFSKKNNSAFFDFTFTVKGDFSFNIINISPKCSFFLRSIILISFFFLYFSS